MESLTLRFLVSCKRTSERYGDLLETLWVSFFMPKYLQLFLDKWRKKKVSVVESMSKYDVEVRNRLRELEKAVKDLVKSSSGGDVGKTG